MDDSLEDQNVGAWSRGMGRTSITLGILATAALLAPGLSALIRLGVSLDPQKAWETGAATSPSLSMIGAVLMVATAIMTFVMAERLNRDERPNRRPIFWIFALIIFAQAVSLIVRNVLGW